MKPSNDLKFALPQLRVLLLLVVALIFGALTCGKPTGRTVPPELIDTWVSTDSRYAGLYLTIERDKFAYSTAAGTVERFKIIEYRRAEGTGNLQTRPHILLGAGEAQTSTLRLVLDPKFEDELTFVNQPNVRWIRQRNNNQ